MLKKGDEIINIRKIKQFWKKHSGPVCKIWEENDFRCFRIILLFSEKTDKGNDPPETEAGKESASECVRRIDELLTLRNASRLLFMHNRVRARGKF